MDTIIGTYSQVSVIMPVYNAEKYLREAIESILTQTFSDFEFLILNDGSTDHSIDIIRSYNDSRIRIHSSGVNRGLIFQLNKGLNLSRGKYIARMDADDISLPERLARQVEFLETHPEIGVLGTGVTIIDGDGNTSHTLQPPTQHVVIKWCLCFNNLITHPSVMMRRQIVGQVGGYNPDMALAEDFDLWRRLSCVTRLSNLKDLLVFYRIHDSNASTIHASEVRQTAVRIRSLLISHILNEEVPVGTVQLLWDQKFQTASDVLDVAGLISRLYKTFVSHSNLSSIERQIIRRDAAMRLYGLSRSKVQDVNVWRVLARACCLDPLLILRVAIGRLCRLFNSRLQPLC